MHVGIDASLLVGFLLAMARATAWMWVSPPFASGGIPPLVRIGLAAAFSLPLAGRLADSDIPLEVAPLVVAIGLQVAAGLLLGFVGVLIFAAVQAAGSMIDLFGGYSAAQIFDPQTGAQFSLFGHFYHLFAITLLFAIDGHLLLVRGFMTSFEAIPLEGIALCAVGRTLTSGLGLLLIAALEIAAPLLAALFLTDVVLGLLSRAAPHMEVFFLGLPLKLLLTLLIMAMALPVLPGTVAGLVERMLRDGLGVLGAG